jgi:hypothetical protein
MSNLVTLCSTCHDEVEISGCTTLSEIMGGDDGAAANVPIEKQDAAQSKRPHWHEFVYGSAKNPLVNKPRRVIHKHQNETKPI